MVIERIDGSLLKKAIIHAAFVLRQNKKTVDELNVFPVPEETPELYCPNFLEVLPKVYRLIRIVSGRWSWPWPIKVGLMRLTER